VRKLTLGGIAALGVLGLVGSFLSLAATELVGEGQDVDSGRDQSQLVQKGQLCVQSERCLNLESRLGNLTLSHGVACGGLSLMMLLMRPLSRLEPRALGFLFCRTVTRGDYDIVKLSLRAKMDWTAGAVRKTVPQRALLSKSLT
jgi:hypothetical protein